MDLALLGHFIKSMEKLVDLIVDTHSDVVDELSFSLVHILTQQKWGWQF